jgi:V-type H+-transporting ATPase subunit C
MRAVCFTVLPVPAQAFGCYMHMSVIRLFVESILRYGLPPQFQAAVVKPLPKMEVRLRTALAANFGTGGSGSAVGAVLQDSAAGLTDVLLRLAAWSVVMCGTLGCVAARVELAAATAAGNAAE